MQQGIFLHFAPENAWFGDPMPLWHDGVWHVYYTKLNTPENARSFMNWGHIASSDLIHWTEYPDPFPLGEENTPFNTGCVFWDKGQYHAYFAGRGTPGRPTMLHAVSDDGISFRPADDVCFARPEQGYHHGATWRDPQVMWDPKSKLYHMVFCSKFHEPETPDCFFGCVGHAVSEDLKTWKCLEPLPLRGVATSPECPDLFPVEDRYALIYYWHETRFRTADNLDGAWERSQVISPDHFDFMAAKQTGDGARRILCGWIPRKQCDCAARTWGGHMAIPRELSFPDGKTPHTRFIRELDQIFPIPCQRLSPAAALRSDSRVAADENGFRFCAANGGQIVSFPQFPQTCRIRFRAVMDRETGMLELFLGTKQGYSKKYAKNSANAFLEDGYVLMFDAAEKMLRLRRQYEWDQRPDLAVIPFDFHPNREFSVDLIWDRTILEVNVDEAQTMVYRCAEEAQGGFGISVQDANARIKDFSVFLPCAGFENN